MLIKLKRLINNNKLNKNCSNNARKMYTVYIILYNIHYLVLNIRHYKIKNKINSTDLRGIMNS